MYLLYKTNTNNGGDFYILYYPDDLKTNYKWLEKILDIIGEISLTHSGKKNIWTN